MSTASKPPWAHLVKEIDEEEAIVLISLGVDVWADWADENNGWCGAPYIIYELRTERAVHSFENLGTKRLYYTRLGDNNDAT